MKKPAAPPFSDSRLRQRAELVVAARPASLRRGAADSGDQAQRQLHELQISQIELEMQHEALAELQLRNIDVENGLNQYATLYEEAPLAYFSISRSGRVARANRAAAQLLRVTDARLMGKKFEQFVAPGEQGGFRSFLEAAFDSGVRQVTEVGLYGALPGAGPVRIEANVDANSSTCRMIVTDLGGPEMRAVGLRRSFLILDQLSDAVLVTDAERRIVSVNPAFTGTTGYRAEESVGRNPSFLGAGLQEADFFLQLYADLFRNHRWQGELWNRRKSGEPFLAQMSITLMRGADGAVCNYVCVFSDITERRQTELALAEAHRVLDRRVEERTAALLDANRMLRQEIDERERAERALRHAERFFHATIDALADRVLVLDERGTVLHANQSCRAFAGHAVNGTPYLAHCAGDPRWQRAGGAAMAAGIAAVIGGQSASFGLEYEFRHAERSHWYQARVTRFAADGPLRIVVAHTDITERKSAERALRDSHARMRQLAAHLETVKEEERRRISRDIHDELGQNLLALRIDISMLAERTAASHPRLHQRVGMVLANLDTTLRNVRGIINGLRPAVLDLGLRAAIEWQVRDFERHSGIAASLRIDQPALFQHLASSTEVVLFRIVQEALTNITRHSRARRAEVELGAAGGYLRLTVRDDGIGIIPQQRAKSQCFGLTGMAERVAALGGRLEVAEFSPGAGCCITLRIPLPA